MADMIDRIQEVIAQAGLAPGPPHECPYLKDRLSRSVAFFAEHLPGEAYEAMMALNFRRSGKVVYRPACDDCRQCQAIRLLVDEYQPNRAQRRCRERNRDLVVNVHVPEPTPEKHELFRRYLAARHQGEMDDDWTAFCRFLYDSPVQTVEVQYRLENRLIAVGLLDVEPAAASTVYCYFDPDLPRRSLGVFNVVWTADWCRRQGIPLLYLGYYIRDCPKMSYKVQYRPCEVLDPERGWRRMPDT